MPARCAGKGVRAAGERGATVVLNSHLLGEVERVCGRVAILDRGRLVADGDKEAIAKREELKNG